MAPSTLRLRAQQLFSQVSLSRQRLHHPTFQGDPRSRRGDDNAFSKLGYRASDNWQEVFAPVAHVRLQ